MENYNKHIHCAIQRLNILSEAQGPTENFLTVWLKFRIEIMTVDLNINYTFYSGKIHGCHAIFCEKSKISRGRPLIIIIYFIRLESNLEPDLQSYTCSPLDLRDSEEKHSLVSNFASLGASSVWISVFHRSGGPWIIFIHLWTKLNSSDISYKNNIYETFWCKISNIFLYVCVWFKWERR